MVRALGGMRHPQRTRYTDDAYRWARRFFHDLLHDPYTIEATSLLCPMDTLKYKEALALANPVWQTTKVLGGSGASWPADELILKVRRGVPQECIAGL
jgi:hypothetical protein